MNNFLSKLGPFQYTLHNMVAHPAMEILHLVGLSSWGDTLHDMTLPDSHRSDHLSEDDEA